MLFRSRPSLLRRNRLVDEDLMTNDGQTEPESVNETVNVYIKNISVALNQNAIDQIEDKQNEDECMQAYWRMSNFNGQMNNQHSAGISYDDFRHVSYFKLVLFRKSALFYLKQSLNIQTFKLGMAISLPFMIFQLLENVAPTMLFQVFALVI